MNLGQSFKVISERRDNRELFRNFTEFDMGDSTHCEMLILLADVRLKTLNDLKELFQLRFIIPKEQE